MTYVVDSDLEEYGLADEASAHSDTSVYCVIQGDVAFPDLVAWLMREVRDAFEIRLHGSSNVNVLFGVSLPRNIGYIAKRIAFYCQDDCDVKRCRSTYTVSVYGPTGRLRSSLTLEFVPRPGILI